MYFFHGFLQFWQKIEILNGGRNCVFLFVEHLPHYFSQIFARSGLRQSFHHVAVFKASHRSYKLPDQGHSLFLHFLLRIVIELISLDSNKSSRNFPLNFVNSSNNNRLSNFAMFHQNFLHLPCRHTMTSRIDNIIFPRHEVEIIILISETWVTRIVMVWMSWKIFLYIFVIIVEDGQHKWWGKRMFNVESTYLSCFTLLTSSWVNNFNITTRKRFTSWSRSLFKRFPTHKISKNWSTSLSLPVVIINQFSLKMFPHPLKSMYITSLTNNCNWS